MLKYNMDYGRGCGRSGKRFGNLLLAFIRKEVLTRMLVEVQKNHIVGRNFQITHILPYQQRKLADTNNQTQIFTSWICVVDLQ